ncbi:MAG: hypothetical protein JWO60_3003 [Frankiales bacterium]|nr:hypothetical protein [Frankiales bacterium]
MRTRLTTGAVLAAAVALLAGSAGAATTLTIDGVTVAAGTATVRGTVVFDAPAAGPVSVGGKPQTASAAPLQAFDAAGVDLQGASIEETAKGLVFTWKLRSLPASPPPEVTRYTWSFGVGEKTFQLQAKRSNAGSLTAVDDPQGHVTSAATGAFQLRGDCAATYGGTPAPVSNCPHLAFLTGAFDPAKGEVRMELPFGTPAAKEIRPGVTLVPVETATMSISAAYQAGVSNTMVSTYINGWEPFRVGRTVEAGVGSAETGEAGAYLPATLDGGSYTASVPVEADEDAVFVRACQAVTCTAPVSAPLG